MSSATTKTKRDTSEKLIRVFFWVCLLGFPLLGLSVVVALVIPAYGETAAAKVLVAKLTFTSLGLLFGVLQVFLGVLLAMVGVTLEYDVDAKMGPAGLKLASASPGILLLILGNLAFAFSLMRQFDVSETTSAGAALGNYQQVPGEPVSGDDPLKGVGGPE